MKTQLITRFVRSERAVSAIEFALVLPVMLTLMFGGYVISQCVAIHRKVTITTRALADLTTDYSTVTGTQLTTIINASTQIMAPYDPTPLKIRLSEVQTVGQAPAACLPLSLATAVTTWSVSVGVTQYAQCTVYPLPAGMYIANTSYIVGEVTYTYTPPVGYKILGPFTIADHIVMLPRISQSIPYTGP